MEKKVIVGKGIKTAVHKLSSVIQIDNVIISSGISPKDFVTEEWAVGVREQTLQCLNNIKIILEAAGATLEDLVVVECFINDVRWYKDYNDAWNEFFAEVQFPPTRSTFQVGLLAPNMNIEMKIVAVKQK